VPLRFWPAAKFADAVARHALARFAALAVGALLFAAAFTSPAAAQGCTFFAPCPPVPAVQGSVHGSAQASLFDIGSHFQNRLGALLSFRTAASRGNNPQGGGADPAVDPTYDRYRTWLEGYGINTTTDAQGQFLGDRRKMYGGLAGAGMTVTPGVTLGVSVDRNTTDADMPGASGRIDMTQIGALGSFEKGPWTLGLTVIHGFGDVNSSRFESGGTSTAAYHARLWGAMAELSYYVALPGNWRFVPKLSFDWLRSTTDAFAETGGTNPISGSAVTATRIRMLVGGEIGHTWIASAWPANSWFGGRQIYDFAVYARLVDNLAQNIDDLIINDTTVITSPQFVTGVRESNLGADAGATLSVKVSQVARLYAVYDGRFRSNLTSHAGTVGAEFRW
jgi:uncharacterized protein with beta-barrel porin domain